MSLELSVIIPTYNRPETLRRTLDCLASAARQGESFEVILVDDGSPEPIRSAEHPFRITLLHQDRQGPTQARNLGAQYSQGQVLVFLDDDICPRPDCLTRLYQAVLSAEKTILNGALLLPEEILRNSSFARAFNEPLPDRDTEIQFPFCKTGLLAIRRQDFFDLGMFQDPTGGWPNWDDVDFGWRASQAGFRIVLSSTAKAEHWDYAAQSMKAAAQRLERAGASAVRLFQVHPIQDSLPMFRDMLPSCAQNSLLIRSRRILRRIASSRPMLKLVEQTTLFLEPRVPLPLLKKLYTWTLGGYIYRGVQTGLAQYGER